MIECRRVIGTNNRQDRVEKSFDSLAELEVFGAVCHPKAQQRVILVNALGNPIARPYRDLRRNIEDHFVFQHRPRFQRPLQELLTDRFRLARSLAYRT